jgi:hypothetical protein
VTLKFEAEATGWLQARAVPLTNDAPKYGTIDADAKVGEAAGLLSAAHGRERSVACSS